MTLAQAVEIATKNPQLMQPQSAITQTVQGNLPQKGDLQKKPCYIIVRNYVGHLPTDCHFKTPKCYNCHKVGNLKKKVCYIAGRTTKDVRQVTEDSPSLSDSENVEYTLFTLNSSYESSKPMPFKCQ